MYAVKLGPDLTVRFSRSRRMGVPQERRDAVQPDAARLIRLLIGKNVRLVLCRD